MVKIRFFVSGPSWNFVEHHAAGDAKNNDKIVLGGNKVVFTTALVAYGWVGAFWQKYQQPDRQMKERTDGWTDRQMDGRTDGRRDDADDASNDTCRKSGSPSI